MTYSAEITVVTTNTIDEVTTISVATPSVTTVLVPTGTAGRDGETERVAKENFAYNSVLTLPLYTTSANERIIRAAILITTPFDDATATLTIGDSGDIDRLMTASQNLPTLTDLFETVPGHLYSSITAINLYISPALSTQGAGIVYLFKG